MQVKDGVAWSALEYMKWTKDKARAGQSEPAQDLVVIPAGIVYTDKSKYRSSAIIELVLISWLSHLTDLFLY
jgi:glycerol-3-phosphate O-acyltransferase/dihydroxyacetone phosphate acyltransferase